PRACPAGLVRGRGRLVRRPGRRLLLGRDPLGPPRSPRGLALRRRRHRRGLGSRRRIRRDPGEASAAPLCAGPRVMSAEAHGLHIAWARLFLRAAASSGVTDVVLSPGSRSTPLAVAAALTSDLRVHVVIDERTAAFFALGQARVTGRPSLL